MSKPRAGLGTILAFKTTPTGYLLTFRRENGQEVERVINPEVAHKLAEAYGVRDRRGGTNRSMRSLKGAAFRYRETSQGLLVEVQVLPA